MLNDIRLRRQKRQQQSNIMIINKLVVVVVFLTVCLALSGRRNEAFLIRSSSHSAARTLTTSSTSPNRKDSENIQPTKTILKAVDFADIVHQGMSVEATNVHRFANDALDDLSSIAAVVANSALLISDESTGGSVASIRQYVPLAVSLFVIVDILLGSPFVNLLMKPMRDASMETGADESSKTISGQDREEMKKKERIDTDRVAQDAIDRAQNALELRNYLESRKSDWDKMEEMKKKLDQSMQKLDDELDAKQRAFDSRNVD